MNKHAQSLDRQTPDRQKDTQKMLQGKLVRDFSEADRAIRRLTTGKLLFLLVPSVPGTCSWALPGLAGTALSEPATFLFLAGLLTCLGPRPLCMEPRDQYELVGGVSLHADPDV